MSARGAVKISFVDDLVRLVHHPAMLAALMVASVLLLVLGVLGIPWLIVRMPADYFAGGARPPVASRPPYVGRFALRILKNALGVVLLFAGVAMLVLPGQGLLTIVVAIGLLDFPGKWRIERRLIRSAPVLRVINGIRARAGRAPLLLPDPGE